MDQHMIRCTLSQLSVKAALLATSVLIATACGTSTPTLQPILPARTSRPTPTHTTTPALSGTLTPVPRSLSEYFVTQEFKECLSRNECKDLKIIDVYEFPASAKRDGWEEQWCVTFVNSDIPVLQVVDSDHYIALINVYEFVPKD
jgi:hypothetical protein